MKADIHPKYTDVNVKCSCGNAFTTRSTYGKDDMTIDVCSECHPFYTGQQKFVDTAGRVDKFQQRLAKTKAASLSQLDEEEGLLEVTRARVASLEARLQDYTIRAPFSGTRICSVWEAKAPT